APVAAAHPRGVRLRRGPRDGGGRAAAAARDAAGARPACPASRSRHLPMSDRVVVDARPVDIPSLRRRGIGRFAASLVPEPAVVTMHDVIPLIRPGQLRTGAVHGLLYAAVRRATRVIAVSEAGRDDLIAHLGVPAERVDVVHEAPAPQFVPTAADAVLARLGLTGPFGLHVGGAGPRKKLGAASDAFATLA